ncbi:Ovule protein [Caenorhabditis elegans]|uniref:Ovule protein n=1 Tax=Caenorhabditis elegans TaxID=6239 RepID=I2HAG4_CAEEL|nr:Ovule protein [Caenorhabditis elegans]CCH63892.1 Ovule protein [Caenorhabditis elegans]|eukprot:NP_001263675.1 Uncharacterized protein CELE_F54D5.23 [Caenorhabditis elegans]
MDKELEHQMPVEHLDQAVEPERIVEHLNGIPLKSPFPSSSSHTSKANKYHL